MFCLYCNTECIKLVCLNCFNDSPMLISMENARYKYKLAKKQIEFYEPTYVRYNHKIKYLTLEIENIAHQLIKITGCKDIQKKAYQKQKIIIEEIQLNNIKLVSTREKVKNIVIELLLKYDIVNQELIQIINNIIYQKCKSADINHFAFATLIVDDIIKYNNKNEKEKEENLHESINTLFFDEQEIPKIPKLPTIKNPTTFEKFEDIMVITNEMYNDHILKSSIKSNKLTIK